MYAVSVLTLGRRGGAKFTYALPLNEPGKKLSLREGLSYVLPRAIYTHPSFKIDMMWVPIATILRLLGLLAVTIGSGTVLGWLQLQFGPSLLAIPDGRLAIVLQVIIMLLSRDFARFLWHYQAHKVPFFWEFHKVHHTAEVLHPFGVRTHPVDMLLRNTYMGGGGALIAGTLFYVIGMQFNPTSAYLFSGVVAILGVIEHFEHSHVSLSFGRLLGRFIYSPYLHQFHHGAAPEHNTVNLGIAGGLTLWDRLFGTLYVPKWGERLVWGVSLTELGPNNPHQTLWGLFWTPFVAALHTLRRPASK
jgi:sterol desaturase/sphingolipid hydroxylase (fatty acid hydroxylase superfamily)